jgi:hypothetical protein
MLLQLQPPLLLINGANCSREASCLLLLLLLLSIAARAKLSWIGVLAAPSAAANLMATYDEVISESTQIQHQRSPAVCVVSWFLCCC